MVKKWDFPKNGQFFSVFWQYLLIHSTIFHISNFKGFPVVYSLYLFSKNLAGDKTGFSLVVEKGAQSTLDNKIFKIEYYFQKLEKKCYILCKFHVLIILETYLIFLWKNAPRFPTNPVGRKFSGLKNTLKLLILDLTVSNLFSLKIGKIFGIIQIRLLKFTLLLKTSFFKKYTLIRVINPSFDI